MSALGGDMVVERGERLDWYSGPTLLELLETDAGRRHGATHAGVPLPGAVRVAARERRRGRGYLGRVEAGSIARRRPRHGAALGPHDDACAQIATLDGTRDQRARLHDSVTLALADEIDISRGDMLVDAAEAPRGRAAHRRDAVLARRASARPRAAPTSCATRRARCARASTRLDHLWNVSTQSREPAPAALAMNDIGAGDARARAADRRPTATRTIRATGSFILIDEATNGTVAAGLIR